MKVSEVMTAQVVTARPETPVNEVAQTMARIESGVVPVVDEGGALIGLITDRDIVLRVVAEGGDAGQPVRDVMTGGVETCREDDNVAEAAAMMSNRQIRRLVVLNEGGRLTGILSLGDLAVDYGAKAVGKTLEDISSAPPSH